ncbi:hypothetical protein MKW98_001807 [Papaver atlanticum]|uniref:ATP-dependent Clp protease proteolytic subunit n=1 Tax=Papaver atlanticum TaxID=357466 RepID=A0AAD4XBP0_9MAGN|nr:hypothetical protein MKW98_001807 [Papaver atlanticum]
MNSLSPISTLLKPSSSPLPNDTYPCASRKLTKPGDFSNPISHIFFSDLMSLLLRERIVFLGLQIDDFVADAIISQSLLLNAQVPAKDIFSLIPLCSMAIYDVLQLVRADVSTIAPGQCFINLLVVLADNQFDVEIQTKEIMQNSDNITNIRDNYVSPVEAVEFGIINGCTDSENILPLMPVPDKVKSRFSCADIIIDPRKFLTPEILDDEIY